jgi:hypothetical protein
VTSPSPRSDPLIVPRGVDWAIGWPVLDTNGASLDLTGWSAQAQARRRAADDEVLVAWSSVSPGGITLLNSMVILGITAQQSASWDWDAAVYDVLLTSPTGQTSLVASGGIELTRTVTRT